MRGGWKLRRRILHLSALAAVLLLTTAASALGQAAIDQYVPSAKPSRHHGSGEGALAAARATSIPPSASPSRAKEQKRTEALSGAPAGPTDSGGGFPLTPFVLLVMLLFLAGVAARYLPEAVRRLRPGPAS
jgi:uncharacterized membrane protein YfcA